MIKLSLRTDIQLKADSIAHTNGRICLDAHKDAFAALSMLVKDTFAPQVLIHMLGDDLFNILQRGAFFSYHILNGEEIFIINPTSKPIALSSFERDFFEGNMLDSAPFDLASTSQAQMPFSSFAPLQGQPSSFALLRMQLSSFALLRQVDGFMLLECPKSYYYLTIQDSSLCVLCSLLAKKISYEDLCFRAEKFAIKKENLNIFLAALKHISALDCDTDIFPQGVIAKKPHMEEAHDVQNEQEGQNGYTFWEFHDLFFHSKSRKDRHANGIIRPFSHRDMSPAPLIKQYEGKKIALAIPEPIQADFFNVLQSRRSMRHFREKNISFEQISAFLYHSLKVQNYREDTLGGISFRPSPSAGALHGLENYILVDTCQGLEQGLYHYNPFVHELVNLPVSEDVMHALWKTAKNMAASAVYPPIYIVTTARFKRYQYKYGPIAYSVMLKDQGCQSQTMNLVAEALGLGGVILADPPLEPFVSALNLKYFEEGVVGSFALSAQKKMK